MWELRPAFIGLFLLRRKKLNADSESEKIGLETHASGKIFNDF